MQLDLTVDTKGIESFSRKYRQATFRALNRAGRTTRTAAQKHVTTTYNIRASEAKKFIKFFPARSINRLIAKIQTRSRRLTLMRFKAKQVARGVRVVIRKRAAKVVRGAFIAPGRGGSAQLVFRRIGRERYPIEPLHTLSIAEMTGTKEASKKIKKRFREAFAKELNRLVARI